MEELTMIADLCKKYDTLCFADEVYEWLIYKPNKHLKIGLCLALFASPPYVDAFMSQRLSVFSCS